MQDFVSLDRLEKEGYSQIISYPKPDTGDISKKLAEMRRLGVTALCFEGTKKIGNVMVLGKGHVGIVVLAKTDSRLAALKIKRTDSGRASMQHEAEVLKIVNKVGVGPRLLRCSENLLLMELAEGKPFSQWINDLGDSEDAKYVAQKVLRQILEQCWRLDEVGVDHGELSNASKHIIVQPNNVVYILDFETASTQRRVSNITSICHYLFLGGATSEIVRKNIVDVDPASLLEALRAYKKSRTPSNFNVILEIFYEKI
ncbi:serine/threonine protein kinase [Candidatus Bathyarchaeota archaeon]|nr:serine/threonine protein kinase [Candidatus Bathyarchaeota archaeon]